MSTTQTLNTGYSDCELCPGKISAGMQGATGGQGRGCGSWSPCPPPSPNRQMKAASVIDSALRATRETGWGGPGWGWLRAPGICSAGVASPGPDAWMRPAPAETSARPHGDPRAAPHALVIQPFSNWNRLAINAREARPIRLPRSPPGWRESKRKKPVIIWNSGANPESCSPSSCRPLGLGFQASRLLFSRDYLWNRGSPSLSLISVPHVATLYTKVCCAWCWWWRWRGEVGS